MKLSNIFKQAKEGRADLAAMNLGAFGYSFRGIPILAKYPHTSGEYFDCKYLYHLYKWYKRGGGEK